MSERRPSWRCLCGLTYVDHSIGVVVCPGYVAAPLPDWGQPSENAAREDEDEAWIEDAAHEVIRRVGSYKDVMGCEPMTAKIIRAAYRSRSKA